METLATISLRRNGAGTSQRYRLRYARPEDLPRVLELARLAFGESRLRDVKEDFERPNTQRTVLVDASGRVMGFQVSHDRNGYRHGAYIATDPSLRGTGVGAAIAANDIRCAGRDGVCFVVEIAVANRKIIDLHRRFGFKPFAIRPRWFDHGSQDALMLYWGRMTPLIAARLWARVLAGGLLSEAEFVVSHWIGKGGRWPGE